MTRPVLVLRPQPGADATAARARALGLEPIVAPLFTIEHRDWTAPAEPPDALLVTSANAARAAHRLPLPAYAVGDATAARLHAEGLANVVTGPGGVQPLIDRAVADGCRALLHLAGEDRTPFDPRGLRIETRIVYAAVEATPSPHFCDALARDAIAVLHSARAARRFRMLAGPNRRIVAISPAVAAAAGPGWAEVAIAEQPIDAALLAAAARLCH